MCYDTDFIIFNSSFFRVRGVNTNIQWMVLLFQCTLFQVKFRGEWVF